MKTAARRSLALAFALIAALLLILSVNVRAEGETPQESAAPADDEWHPAEVYGASNITAAQSKCRLCGICPVQPLGICLFVWIGAAAILAVMIVIYIRAEKKKKAVIGLDDDDDDDEDDE